MRKITFALVAAIALMFGTQAKAQHDVKLNFLGFLFGQYGVTYENVLSEQMGLGLGANYFSYKVDDDKWSGYSITPEFRFYFNPDDDAEGFFAGPYLKWRGAKSTGWYDPATGTDDATRSNNGLALGLGLGRKWVADAGFIFETYLGVGKYLVETEKYSTQSAEDYWTTGIEVTNLSSIDVRLGLGIGWRF